MSIKPETSLDGFHLTWENQQADLLAREYLDVVNQNAPGELDRILAPTYESHRHTSNAGRSGTKNFIRRMHIAFPDFKHEVHESVGVVVDDDLLALRTYVSGTHEGPWGSHAPTGKSFRVGNHQFFRHSHGRLTEHWEVADRYGMLAQLGLIPVSIPLYDEKPGSDFGVAVSTQVTTPEANKAVVRAMYNGVVATGKAEDGNGMLDGYIQNTGRAPDGAAHFNEEFVGFRQVFQKGRAHQVQILGERDRVITRSRWDGEHLGVIGAIEPTGHPVDFTTADTFRFDGGLIAEHWDTTDFMAMLTSLELIPPAE